MRLTFLGKETQTGNSPTLWDTDEDQYVIQGFTLDADALAQVGTVPEGERYLPRHLTEDVDLPGEDFWLLDDDVLVLSVFSPDGRTGGFARSSSPELLKQCIAVRDQVWKRAIPYTEYAA